MIPIVNISMRCRLFIATVILVYSLVQPSWAAEYNLVIAKKAVIIDGETFDNKLTVNGSIPGPVLRFVEGEEAIIHVENHLDDPSSVHWHGLLLPGFMDGVPGLNGFAGIAPGETFTYRFPIRQSGTYWYHSHTKGQEQDGLYGAIVIKPRPGQTSDGKATSIPSEFSGVNYQVDRDYVILVSDFHRQSSSAIFRQLKASSEFYQRHKRTVGDFIEDTRQMGWSKAWDKASTWGKMRMSRTDLSDVSGYHFLINGLGTEDHWRGLFKPDERVRLRFINGSSMSFYDLRLRGPEDMAPMELIAVDGQDVEPVMIDEFRFGPGETYDVIVTPTANAYTIVAESIDRSGWARAMLASETSGRGPEPRTRPRAELSLSDMGHGHHQENQPSSKIKGAIDHQAMGHLGDMLPNHTRSAPVGWADASTPLGKKKLNIADLRLLTAQADQREPEHTITMRLSGNMERYVWMINGQTFPKPFILKHGDRVRLTFVNQTMMAHPMHLHGMFFQVENGQPPAVQPNKHTLVIPPGQSQSILVTANVTGQWAFHCHMLYHMMAGMFTFVTITEPDATPLAYTIP